MSRIHKALCASLGVLVCLFFVAFLNGRLGGQKVTLVAASEQPLNESQAVELSRQALTLTGHKSRDLSPQRFQTDNTNYYARNTITSYDGYVLWASMGWTSTSVSNEAFVVNLEQRGTQVLCTVIRPK